MTERQDILLGELLRGGPDQLNFSEWRRLRLIARVSLRTGRGRGREGSRLKPTSVLDVQDAIWLERCHAMRIGTRILHHPGRFKKMPLERAGIAVGSRVGGKGRPPPGAPRRIGL